ncbi:hypothetical protein J2S17_005603 [Cytobacillus purgationiresistens]|uniref:Uncharacterized protein n=1 Tax=Cytobacillus purgationiresistens TaxID=863449 RepID=A0ABU0AQV2_9BACI|nr:hypothetical protein [Cytobacillus purgationiresistens]
MNKKRPLDKMNVSEAGQLKRTNTSNRRPLMNYNQNHKLAQITPETLVFGIDIDNFLNIYSLQNHLTSDN